jgi:hypothetical protein
MASMVCFRQAQILNRAGKGHKARLLTETSGMVVFAVCRLPPAAADVLFPVVASAILSPSLRRISKKDFPDSLIFEQEVTGESADERRSHHRVARLIELFDQLLLRHRRRVPRNGVRRDMPVDNLQPLR